MSKIIAYASSTRLNHLWSAAQFNSALPKNRTDADIPLVAQADLNVFKGKYRSMASLMEKARSQLRQVTDHIEDEGDRAYFGSTNHADWLRDLAEDMEAWVIDFELPKGDINKMERDPYAEIREQRARADKAEEATENLADKIEDLISEFGDNPKAALECVAEYLSLRRHPGTFKDDAHA